MPKLRTITKPEDSADIPETEGVRVNLGAAATETETNKETTGAEGTQGTIKESQAKEPKIEPVRQAPEPEEGGEALKALQKRFDDQKRAGEEALAQAAEFEKRNRETQAQLQEREKELVSVRGTRDQAEYDAVTNALAAAQTESESAQQTLETAHTNGDYKAVSEAQRRLARAETRIVQLEDAEAQLKARREKAATERPNGQTTQRQPTFEEHVDGLPNLMPKEKQWLKDHPDALTDTRRNARLQAAYYDAQDANLSRGTEDYFKFLEEKLGYRKADKQPIESEDDGEIVVAAPVSREAPSPSTGRPTNNRTVELTAEQRAHAKASGVDDVTYARNLVKMLELQKSGQIQ